MCHLLGLKIINKFRDYETFPQSGLRPGFRRHSVRQRRALEFFRVEKSVPIHAVIPDMLLFLR